MDRGVALPGKRHIHQSCMAVPTPVLVKWHIAWQPAPPMSGSGYPITPAFCLLESNAMALQVPAPEFLPGQPCLVSSLVSGRSPGGRPANLSLSREPHTIWCGFRIRIKLRTEKATQLRKVLIMVGTCSMSAVFGAIAGNQYLAGDVLSLEGLLRQMIGYPNVVGTFSLRKLIGGID